MPIRDPSLVQKLWRDQPNVNSVAVYDWLSFMNKTDHALNLEYDYERWLQSQHTSPPDMVAAAACYGYVRLKLQDWKLPFQLSSEETERWREAGFFMSLEDFQEDLAGVAGFYLGLGGSDPQALLGVLSQQLKEKLTELENLVSVPLKQYTPEYTEPLLRKLFTARGLSGGELESAIADELGDDDPDREFERINRPFTLRDQLESFEWAMEKFRLFCQSEYDPELGLPNQQLFDALMQIDLNGLIAELEKIDTKLRKIAAHLATFNYNQITSELEPEQFWWRHWQKQARKS